MSPRGSTSVIWHELECAGYTADLPVWRRLAARHPGPVLEIGAGTGRVALDLAQRGHEVIALDNQRELLGELSARAARLGARIGRPVRIRTVMADARDFDVEVALALILVPMQTVQLLGQAGRAAFLNCAVRHLEPGGRLAVALTEHFDLYGGSGSGNASLPPPNVRAVSGTVYRSHPTAVRLEGETVVLERRRERLLADRSRKVEDYRVALDLLSPALLEEEGARVGLRATGRVNVPPTPDHVGSVVVSLGA